MGENLVMLIPIFSIISGTAIIVCYSPMARAMAARMRGEQASNPELVATIQEQADRLTIAEDAIEQLEQKVEFQERLLTTRSAASGSTE